MVTLYFFNLPIFHDCNSIMSSQKYREALGAQIKKMRQKKGITQAELARLTDKERSHINRLEKGGVNPTVDYLKMVADALEIPVRKFFDFEKSLNFPKTTIKIK